MSLIRWVLRAVIAATILSVAYSYVVNRSPYNQHEITEKAQKLFWFGAVAFVHDAYDQSMTNLFSCVEIGQELTAAQSIAYRTEYQSYLQSRAGLFTALDQDIQFMTDFKPDHANNIAGHGIAGHHDMHDLSARNNIVDIADQLQQLPDAWVAKRIILANDIYKDLTDLMVHLAPAVHSVGLLDLEAVDIENQELAALYTGYYKAMKQAQGVPLNTSEYRVNIDNAVSAYADLAAFIQTAIWQSNGAWAHALSGRWLSLQTVAPRLAKTPSTLPQPLGPCPA